MTVKNRISVVRACALLGIFFLVTIHSAFAKGGNEDKKTNPQSQLQAGIPQGGSAAKLVAEEVYARSTYYNRREAKCDKDTLRKKTSARINIAIIESRGLGAVAVDPAKVPYGSLIIAPNGKKFVAADTGGAVKARKAAIEHAEKLGFGPQSAEYKALVLDFYSDEQIGGEWTKFRILRYEDEGFPFADLSLDQKISHLDRLRSIK